MLTYRNGLPYLNSERVCAWNGKSKVFEDDVFSSLGSRQFFIASEQVKAVVTGVGSKSFNVCSYVKDGEIVVGSKTIAPDEALPYDGIRRLFNRIGEVETDISSRLEFNDWVAYESMIRMASPVSGIYYGSLDHLADSLGHNVSTVKRSVERLSESGKIDPVASLKGNLIYRIE